MPDEIDTRADGHRSVENDSIDEFLAPVNITTNVNIIFRFIGCEFCKRSSGLITVLSLTLIDDSIVQSNQISGASDTKISQHTAIVLLFITILETYSVDNSWQKKK